MKKLLILFLLPFLIYAQVKIDKTVNRNTNQTLQFSISGNYSSDIIYLTAKRTSLISDTLRLIDHECDSVYYNSTSNISTLFFDLLPSETQSIGNNLLVYDIKVENSSTERELLVQGNLKMNLTPRLDSDVEPTSSVPVIVINPTEFDDSVFVYLQNDSIKSKTINDIKSSISYTNEWRTDISDSLVSVEKIINVGEEFGYTNSAITQAIASLNGEAGTLLFDNGTWLFTSYVNLGGKSNILFKAKNKNKAIFEIDGNVLVGQMFYCNSLTQNITFDGIYATAIDSYPNDLLYHKNSTYNKNSFCDLTYVNNISIYDCYFYGFSKHGIRLRYADRVNIKNNRFYKSSFSSKNIVVEASNSTADEIYSKNIWIENNSFGRFGSQKQVEIGTANDNHSIDCIHLDDCRFFYILSNRIDSSASHSIRSEQSQFGTIKGNIITNSGGIPIFLYSNSQYVVVENNVISKWGLIPPSQYVYKYAGHLYYLTEYKWGIVKFGNANPALANLVEEYPYVIQGDTSVTTVFDTTTIANYPQRGLGAIHLSYDETYMNVISSNVIEGDLTQVGGKYKYANDFGIVLGMHYNNGGATTNTTGDNVVSNNIVKNVIQTTRQIYSPQYQDSLQHKGAQLYTNKFSGNKASLQNGSTYTSRD